MARLPKRRLIRAVEDALRRGGWNLLHLSDVVTHPARYQIYRGGRGLRIRVYVWNLTRGGANRPGDEWRIQVTGINRFEPEIDGRTLILGWLDDEGLFAGFDYAHHAGSIGTSPSIQLRESALRQAAANGFAAHDKGNGELVIAFQAAFLASYADNLESLHACGRFAGEIETLRGIGTQPDGPDDDAIAATVAEPRRYAVLSARRALRDADFRDRVLDAYHHGCAMCGVQLRLVDGAHILPAAHPESTDGTDNGVALCALHHRAFDRGFVTFTPDFAIQVNDDVVRTLEDRGRAAGLEAFTRTLKPALDVPADERDRPARRFVEAGNQLRGWLL